MAIPLPCRRLSPLLSLLVFCAGISPASAGDPADFTYRASANEVRLSFAALDQNNHAVATLQSSDFAVVDRDVIVHNFQSFTRTDWTKLEIAILIDASESVTPRVRQEMADVSQLLSQTTGVPDENLSMFSFHDRHPVLLCAEDCRASGAATRLPATGASGVTPIFDTILFASDYLSHHGDARALKVIIVFSDGVDTVSRNSLDDAVATSLMENVQLDCIDLNRSLYSSQGRAVLYRLANATGGRYFAPPDGAARALNVILEESQATYTVTYRLPSHARGFHAVRILPTHNRNLQFLSRNGYYFPNQVR